MSYARARASELTSRSRLFASMVLDRAKEAVQSRHFVATCRQARMAGYAINWSNPSRRGHEHPIEPQLCLQGMCISYTYVAWLTNRLSPERLVDSIPSKSLENSKHPSHTPARPSISLLRKSRHTCNRERLSWSQRRKRQLR